jgi:hypothetical protein
MCTSFFPWHKLDTPPICVNSKYESAIIVHDQEQPNLSIDDTLVFYGKRNIHIYTNEKSNEL